LTVHFSQALADSQDTRQLSSAHAQGQGYGGPFKTN